MPKKQEKQKQRKGKKAGKAQVEQMNEMMAPGEYHKKMMEAKKKHRKKK